MMDTCYDAFETAAAQHGRRDFLHIPLLGCNEYSDAAITWTYSEAGREITSLAKQYAAGGIGHDHRVALVLDNRAEFFLHFLALNSLGACIVPVHSDLPPREAAYLIDHSDSVAVVALKEHGGALCNALALLSSPIPWVTPDKLCSLDVSTTESSSDRPSIDSDAAIIFTSGTTGKPKGCVLSNRYFHGWGRMYTNLGHMARLRPGKERLLTPLPTNHVNGLACSFMGMLYNGGCSMPVNRFSSSKWWETVHESKATIVHYLGVMPAMLLNLAANSSEDFGKQVRFGLGAGIDPRHHREFERRFGFPLLEGWAMTETGGVACVMAHEEPREIDSRCFGKPPATMRYRIVDDAGNDVETGDGGELWVRAAGDDPRRGFFSGYYKNEAATEEAWEGGYFHTGDIVRLGGQGNLHFVDRRKNIIRRSGENIAAAEVEEALLAQDAVALCAVAATPDELREEEVIALIVPAVGFTPDAALATQIVRDCLATISYFKAPGHVGFVEELPLGATQKIKVSEIQLLCSEVMDSDSHFDCRRLKKK